MVDEKLIEHLGKLARLQVSSEEAQDLSTQLTKVLAAFEQISKIQTDQVEPLITPVQLETYWRSDSVQQDTKTADLLEGAPDKVGNLFRVPPVV